MNVLSLFAGIGGIDLGLQRAGMTIVGQVEIDPWCRRVLAKHWPEVPRHDDIRTFAPWWFGSPRPYVDLLAGGFPCQPISLAGARLGVDDPRWLWPVFATAIRSFRPRYVVLENVPAVRNRGRDVFRDLAACGYDVQWDCLPASAFGAHHRRDRWFAVAYPHRAFRRHPGAAITGTGIPAVGGESSQSGRRGAVMADPDGPRRQPGSGLGWSGTPFVGDGGWPAEPDVGRMAHGVPGRMDRLRGLGNAVVPKVAEYVGRLMMARESQRKELAS